LFFFASCVSIFNFFFDALVTHATEAEGGEEVSLSVLLRLASTCTFVLVKQAN
jgi:hypothetical protein